MVAAKVIVHFDCDAFYAQCEEVRDPSLRRKPLGVTQKYLIVTSNYPARARGVGKLMGIREAQQLCPDLVLINGEDLTPYRRASKKVVGVLQRFGVAEKLGMDETVVDVTEEVERRIARGDIPLAWSGHLHTSQMEVVQENRHRVMDLRAVSSTMGDVAVPTGAEGLGDDAWEVRLKVGSQVAAEARAAVKAEAGFRTSAGIASNRMLAKLVSGLHKPDDQTTLPPTHAAAFVAPLPLRAIPGVGSKLGGELQRLGLEKVADLRAWQRASLAERFGERQADFLFQACRGVDPTPVKTKPPSKAITVEDSFKSCTSVEATRHITQILAPDLLARLHEEFEEEGRKPKTLTLKWRHRENGWSRNSASCPFPAAVQVAKPPDDAQASAVVQAAMAVFCQNVKPPFNLTLLNLGATNFSEGGGGSARPHPSFARLLRPVSGLSAPAAISSTAGSPGGQLRAARLIHARRDQGAASKYLPVSKTQERLLREGLPPGSAPAAAAPPSSSDPWEVEHGWQHSPPASPVTDAGILPSPTEDEAKFRFMHDRLDSAQTSTALTQHQHSKHLQLPPQRHGPYAIAQPGVGTLHAIPQPRMPSRREQDAEAVSVPENGGCSLGEDPSVAFAYSSVHEEQYRPPVNSSKEGSGPVAGAAPMAELSDVQSLGEAAGNTVVSRSCDHGRILPGSGEGASAMPAALQENGDGHAALEHDVEPRSGVGTGPQFSTALGVGGASSGLESGDREGSGGGSVTSTGPSRHQLNLDRDEQLARRLQEEEVRLAGRVGGQQGRTVLASKPKKTGSGPLERYFKRQKS